MAFVNESLMDPIKGGEYTDQLIDHCLPINNYDPHSEWYIRLVSEPYGQLFADDSTQLHSKHITSKVQLAQTDRDTASYQHT
jgi:hypothetical protein